jgi:hypothetical protein
MKVIDTFERRALLPISRAYAVVVSLLAMIALAASALAVIYFHLLANRDPGTLAAPAVNTQQIQYAIAPARPTSPATAPSRSQSSRADAPQRGDAVVSPIQQALSDLAREVDPEKKRAFFDAYEKADAAVRTCANGFDIEFIVALKTVFVTLKKSASDVTFGKVVDAFCGAWRADLQRQRATIQAQANESSEARGLRSGALTVLFGSLVAIAALALPLALLAIERNTRATEAMAKLLGELRPGPTMRSFILAALLLVPSYVAMAQISIETESQRQQRVAREAEAKRMASVQGAIRDRSMHVGKTYAFNPAGRENTGDYLLSSQGGLWFYRSMPLVYGKASGDRFRPQAIVDFTVEKVESRACFRDEFMMRGPVQSIFEEMCVYYQVRIGRDLLAYLELGRYGKHDSKLGGIDALGAVSSDPKDMMLIARPDEIAARLAEQRRRAEADRAAQSERDAAARRMAAENEARRREAAALEEQLRRKAVLEKRRAQLADQYGPDMANAVIDGRIEPGWPMAMVEDAWGRPLKIRRVPSGEELWEYPSRYVTFENGKVANVVQN